MFRAVPRGVPKPYLTVPGPKFSEESKTWSQKDNEEEMIARRNPSYRTFWPFGIGLQSCTVIVQKSVQKWCSFLVFRFLAYGTSELGQTERTKAHWNAPEATGIENLAILAGWLI